MVEIIFNIHRTYSTLFLSFFMIASLYLSIWHTFLPQNHFFPCWSTPLPWNFHVALGNAWDNTRESYPPVSASMKTWTGKSYAQKCTLPWSRYLALRMCVVQVYWWVFHDHTCMLVLPAWKVRRLCISPVELHISFGQSFWHHVCLLWRWQNLPASSDAFSLQCLPFLMPDVRM